MLSTMSHKTSDAAFLPNMDIYALIYSLRAESVRIRSDDPAFVDPSMSPARLSGHQSKKKAQEELHGPHGSSWCFQHLNCLHIHLTVGYDPKDLSSVVLTPKLYNIKC